MALRVSSPAFSNGSDIPNKYTCDGDDLAPPLEWSGVPKESKSVAVICDDPDAPSGTFTHWVLYDIPASAQRLAEGAAIGTAGVNSFGKPGFGGPCPPKKDHAHHYHFHVYALDVDSLGKTGMSKEDALEAMSGHIVAEGELVGTYRRTAA
jgi:Raf kinase inhibitor-like YbhB/YbcL family protein